MSDATRSKAPELNTSGPTSTDAQNTHSATSRISGLDPRSKEGLQPWLDEADIESAHKNAVDMSRLVDQFNQGHMQGSEFLPELARSVNRRIRLLDELPTDDTYKSEYLAEIRGTSYAKSQACSDRLDSWRRKAKRVAEAAGFTAGSEKETSFVENLSAALTTPWNVTDTYRSRDGTPENIKLISAMIETELHYLERTRDLMFASGGKVRVGEEGNLPDYLANGELLFASDFRKKYGQSGTDHQYLTSHDGDPSSEPHGQDLEDCGETVVSEVPQRLEPSGSGCSTATGSKPDVSRNGSIGPIDTAPSSVPSMAYTTPEKWTV